MRLLTPSLALLLLHLSLDNLWIQPVQASFFSSSSSSSSDASTKLVSCGASHSRCPIETPCCNNGTCHKTSLQACSLSLGCEPQYSGATDDKNKSKDNNRKSKKDGDAATDQDEDEEQDLGSCFPLPVCRSFKETFKHNKGDKHGQHRPLIPKADFLGDPDLAHWTSDFDHIAPYATIDPKHKRLVLKARRDTVKTVSGGGFGATVSSTRWNRYGTFSAKFKSGATGPGIVTAMMLSNPNFGEEITLEVTGRDPKTVITDFYRQSAEDRRSGSTGSTSSSSSWLPSMIGLKTRTRKLKNMILPGDGTHGKKKDKVTASDGQQGKEGLDNESDHNNADDNNDYDDNSLEQSHALKRSVIEHELVYKIEWTPDQIRWYVDGSLLRTLTSKTLLRERGYGLPSHPMLLQFTIWDAGYDDETRHWAGGATDYGENDDKEYVTAIDWIDIACHDAKEAKRNPWPGKEAQARLDQVAKEEKEQREAEEKKAKLAEADEKKEAKRREKEEKKLRKKAGKAGTAVMDQSNKRRDVATTAGSWLFFGRGKHQGDGNDTDSTRGNDKRKTSGSSAGAGWIDRFLDAVLKVFMRWTVILMVLVGSASYLTQPGSVYARRTYQAPEASAPAFKVKPTHLMD